MTETLTWQQEYDLARQNLPTEGVILTSNDPQKMVKLNIVLTEGMPPFIYCLLFLPCIVGQPPKWAARNIDDDTPHGWKGILLSKARDLVIRKHGLSNPVVPVKSIKIVRAGHANDCLLIEINEF